MKVLKLGLSRNEGNQNPTARSLQDPTTRKCSTNLKFAATAGSSTPLGNVNMALRNSVIIRVSTRI